MARGFTLHVWYPETQGLRQSALCAASLHAGRCEQKPGVVKCREGSGRSLPDSESSLQTLYARSERGMGP